MNHILRRIVGRARARAKEKGKGKEKRGSDGRDREAARANLSGIVAALSILMVIAASAIVAAQFPPTPFMISGWVSNSSGVPVNNPNVTINNTNTGEIFIAATNASSNYYQVITFDYNSYYNISAGDKLHFNVTDNGNQTEFDHIVTVGETKAGGFVKNITLGRYWTEDIRVTYAPGYYKEMGSIALDSNCSVHVVWIDMRNGTGQYPAPTIYYAKLDNNGNKIINDTRIASNLHCYHPCVAVDSNDNVHIFWDQYMGTAGYEIYYEKLDNNGNTLVDDKRITNVSGWSMSPSIAIDTDDNIHLVWADHRGNPENYDIYYMKLDNNGNNLTNEVRVTNARGTSENPKIVIDSENNLHIVWDDWRDWNGGEPQISEIYYEKLDSNGNTLIDDLRLTYNASRAFLGNVVIDSEDNIHIGWQDYRHGNPECYYKKIDKNGNTLINDTRLTNDTAYSSAPDIAIDSHDMLHVVWKDTRDGNPEIYYMELDKNGSKQVEDLRLTNATGRSWNPVIAVESCGNAHVVWQDDRNDPGNNSMVELYYKKNVVNSGCCNEHGNPDGDPAIEVNKTVWDGSAWVKETTANLGDTLRFRIWIHNNGTCCNLTNITVVDILSDSLNYSDDATPREPNEIIYYPCNNTTLVWNFSGLELEPCQNITIEFNATVVKCPGVDTNTVNVTAECEQTVVSAEDTAKVAVMPTPVLIYGWVEYSNGTEVLGPNVSITNLNTSEDYTVETSASYSLSLIHISEPTRPY